MILSLLRKQNSWILKEFSKNVENKDEADHILYSKYVRDLRETKESLQKYTKKVNRYKDYLYCELQYLEKQLRLQKDYIIYSKLSKEYQERQCILKQQQKLEKYNKDILDMRTRISMIENYIHNKSLQKDILEIDKKIKTQRMKDQYVMYKNLLQEEKYYLETINNNNKYKKIIKEMSIDYTCQAEFLRLKEEHLNLKKTIEMKEIEEGNIKEERKISKQLDTIQDKIDIYERYLQLVHKSNIPLKLILRKTSYIEDHINLFLKKLTNFTIKIELKSGLQFIVHKGLTLDVDQLSGYETFILNIALKSALNKYSFISKSKLFVIDEGLDVVDKDNFKKINILIDLLKRDYRHIVLISHIMRLQHICESQISKTSLTLA